MFTNKQTTAAVSSLIWADVFEFDWVRLGADADGLSALLYNRVRTVREGEYSACQICYTHTTTLYP